MSRSNGRQGRGRSLGPLVHETAVCSSKDLNSTAMCFIPSSSNNPAFVSFCRYGEIGLGMQRTLQEQHAPKVDGFPMLYGRLKDSEEQHFVVVVPSGHM